MVSDAVSSSHGRQEYGTAALAPEGLRRAYREVTGRREAGARRRGATPPDVRGSPPDGGALGDGPVHGCAQERRPPSRHRRRDCNRGWVSHRGAHVHAAHARGHRARLHAYVQVRSPARHRGGAGHQAVPDQGPGGHEQHRPQDRKSTRLNSSHSQISYAVFCLKKKKKTQYIDSIKLLFMLDKDHSSHLVHLHMVIFTRQPTLTHSFTMYLTNTCINSASPTPHC